MRRGAGRGAGGATGSVHAVRRGGAVAVRSGGGAAQERCGAARCGAVRRRGGAGLGAGGAGTRLALISYSNFSAPTQPARHWRDVTRGHVTPARAHWLRAARRSCADYHISASGGAAARLGFARPTFPRSLFVFPFILSSCRSPPSLSLISRHTFHFPSRPRSGSCNPFPRPGLLRHIYNFHMDIYIYIDTHI